MLAEGIERVGGILGAALITTGASQGAQYVGQFLFNRGIGDNNRNVQVGLSANIIVTALATAGIPVVREVFVVLGIGLGLLVISIGILSDLRGIFYRRGGVGVFFGTFNPCHNTHVALIQRAIDERQLEKVYVHPTLVPRLHRIWLERGDIRVARIDGGVRILERTEKADANVNYFPTGNRFFPPELRRELLQMAVDEARIGNKVEVAFFPETYEAHGFHGVLRRIKKMHPNTPIHGIHGSDFAGMTVRAILDECGWIYPLAVCRRDGISATAIRNGAQGMTGPAVTAALLQLRQHAPEGA